MFRHISTSIRLTLVMIVICSGFYFGIVALIGKMTPGNGNGVSLTENGRTVGYSLIGQKFSEDKYFWGRPSAVDYNAAGSAGSNKGPSNPDYLKTVQERIDTFLVHNPTVKKTEIPAELVTASGSGLDPHISPAAAKLQISRIAATRKLQAQKIRNLIDTHTEKHSFGPDVVNVLELNIDLDKLK